MLWEGTRSGPYRLKHGPLEEGGAGPKGRYSRPADRTVGNAVVSLQPSSGRQKLLTSVSNTLLPSCQKDAHPSSGISLGTTSAPVALQNWPSGRRASFSFRSPAPSRRPELHPPLRPLIVVLCYRIVTSIVPSGFRFRCQCFRGGNFRCI